MKNITLLPKKVFFLCSAIALVTASNISASSSDENPEHNPTSTPLPVQQGLTAESVSDSETSTRSIWNFFGWFSSSKKEDSISEDSTVPASGSSSNHLPLQEEEVGNVPAELTQSIVVLKESHISLSEYFDNSSYTGKNRRLSGVSFGLYEGATYIIRRKSGSEEKMDAEGVESIGKTVEAKTKLLAIKKGDEFVWKTLDFQEQ